MRLSSRTVSYTHLDVYKRQVQGLSDEGELPLEFEGRCALHVQREALSGDLQRAVVDPLVRIANLIQNGRELEVGLAFGGRLHPGHGVDVAAHRGFDALDHLLHTSLALRRKHLRDVHLPERVAQIDVHCDCAATPVWRLLALTGKRALVREVGVAPRIVDDLGSVEEQLPTKVKDVYKRQLLTLALILAIMPWDANRSGQSPFVRVIAATHLPYASGIVNFVILIAALSAMNSQLYITTRMMFSLSRAGYAPLRFGPVSYTHLDVYKRQG